MRQPAVSAQKPGVPAKGEPTPAGLRMSDRLASVDAAGATAPTAGERLLASGVRVRRAGARAATWSAGWRDRAPSLLRRIAVALRGSGLVDGGVAGARRSCGAPAQPNPRALLPVGVVIKSSHDPRSGRKTFGQSGTLLRQCRVPDPTSADWTVALQKGLLALPCADAARHGECRWMVRTNGVRVLTVHSAGRRRSR